MKIYIMLPFTSVIDMPKTMEYSAQLTEDYMEQFGSARFVYSSIRSGLIRRSAHYTGSIYKMSWMYTRVRPETFKLYREEES